MNLKRTRGKPISTRMGVVAAAAVAALTGFGGSAAVPSDQVTQFNPTAAVADEQETQLEHWQNLKPQAENG